MASKTPPNYLRRYTTLSKAVEILKNKKIILGSYEHWIDENDKYFLDLYKKDNKLKTLVAICLTQRPETYHHWSVFSKGSELGVCIQFNREKFLSHTTNIRNIEAEPINYVLLKNANPLNFFKKDLPFLKRRGFKDEGEFRIIYKSKKESLKQFEFEIIPDCIQKIIFSPFLDPEEVAIKVAELKKIPNFESCQIAQSTLISNKGWMDFGAKLIT